MTGFSRHVDNVMAKQSAGEVVSTTYGQKRDGTHFALVKTKVLWYAVRLIIEGSYAVERDEFYLESAADNYIAAKKRALEGCF
uniref:AP2/ERF domain-containing protein n=1 Tax=Panagrellus redivivus TaxID=6233 RepID=A0A7E4WAV9_PANRE